MTIPLTHDSLSRRLHFALSFLHLLPTACPDYRLGVLYDITCNLASNVHRTRLCESSLGSLVRANVCDPSTSVQSSSCAGRKLCTGKQNHGRILDREETGLSPFVS